MNTPIWIPKSPEKTRLYAFQQWVEQTHHLHFKNYEAFHTWSVQHFPLFWKALADYFQVSFNTPPISIFEKTGPGLWENSWFKGATFNITRHMLQGKPEQLALVSINENNERQTFTYAQLKDAVSACAAGLKQAGVKAGDRVAAMMPNNAQTIIAMLATANIGAVWSSCSPDFGAAAAIDRFSQIEPCVLFLCDGQRYNGKVFSTLSKLTQFIEQLPTLKQVVICPVIEENFKLPEQPKLTTWQDFLIPDSLFEPLMVSFSHPLYILFSSGTTGKPKCIMHGAGATLLQHLKELALHSNLSEQDNLCFYTTCGWMMWNWMVSGLALGMTLTLYDGAALYPTPDRLWQLIEAEKITAFGTSAKYLAAVEKAELKPNTKYDLSALKLILSTGSPLLPSQFDFVYQHINSDLQLSSISGGTDIVSCFVLGNPMLPVYQGEIQCAGLGMDVQVYNDNGQPVIEQKGELVCTRPFPSIPLGFWNDPHQERFQQTYFSRFANTWTHGDYAEKTNHDSFIIYGRSDTTLNPGGVRIGSAEIYREIERIPEIVESVVIGQTWYDDVRVVLFVKLGQDQILSESLQQKIKQRLKENASPRHVPALILAVQDIPKTLNGKIVEQAIKQTIEGRVIENLSSIANPEALDYFKNRVELES
jgi:acetoacetyl-CoA synthetase